LSRHTRNLLRLPFTLLSLFTHLLPIFFFFFFNDPATPEIYTLSLHDALPISWGCSPSSAIACFRAASTPKSPHPGHQSGSTLPLDRKSTRLNSSHVSISYAVFCLKKKKKKKKI